MSETLLARAKEWVLGTAKSGKVMATIMFVVEEGPRAGDFLTARLFFTEAAVDRTLEALRHCGWDGDNLEALTGLDANQVQIVTEHEEYEGKSFEKVKWINRPSSANLGEALQGAALAAFAAQMRGKCVASKQSYKKGAPAPKKASPAPTRKSGGPQPLDDDDLDQMPF